MNYLISLLLNNYTYIALTSSLLFGIFAEFIFWSKEQRNKQTLIQHIYQFWLNFTGSLTGWWFLYFTITSFEKIGIEKISFIHLIFGVLGIIGVVGLLPTTLAVIVNSVSVIVQKIVEKLLDK